MNGPAHHGASPDDARSRHTASAARRRIGWRAANRIVSGKDGGPGAEGLHALIAVASTSKPKPSAPASAASFASADRTDAEADAAGREAMLAAYRESAADWESRAGRRARSGNRARQGAGDRHTSRALVLRFATAVLLVCGVGVAAAGAGVLPAGVQRIAHDYLGIGGVSAPATHVAPSSGAAIGPSTGSGGDGNGAAAPSMAAGGSNAAPASSEVIMALCQKVSQDGDNWEAGVNAAGRATLIAAAGDERTVKTYCARQLASGGDGNGNGGGNGHGSGNGNGPTPPPAASTKPSPAPSAGPTETHGKTHASRSPDAHGAG